MQNKRAFSGKGGFTLVEVMVTLIITVIVIAVSSTLVITGTNIFARSAQRDLQNNIAETVLSFVSEQLLYAYDIEQKGFLTADGTSITYSSVNGAILQVKHPDGGTANGGYLFFRRDGDSGDPVNIFGNNFYSNYIVELNLDIKAKAGTNSAYFTLTVNVINKNSLNSSPVLSRTMSRPLLNYAKVDRPGLNAQYGAGGAAQFIFIDPRPPA